MRDVATKNNVRRHVCDTIREHHDDVHSSAESFIVAARGRDKRREARGPQRHGRTLYQAARGAGRGRPRFRRRRKVLRHPGGSRGCASWSEPESVDDLAATKMAREIVKQIEATLAYPGQIKVTVIRESRSVEFAR